MSDAEDVFLTAGGVVAEVRGLTREGLVVCPPAPPLLLVPAGVSAVARERMVAAALAHLLLLECDRDSLLAALAVVARPAAALV